MRRERKLARQWEKNRSVDRFSEFSHSLGRHLSFDKGEFWLVAVKDRASRPQSAGIRRGYPHLSGYLHTYRERSRPKQKTPG